jgi:phytoene/squalene synthetase
MIQELTASTQVRSGEVLECGPESGISNQVATFYPELPVLITRAASKQAYYTIRYLVDHDRRFSAYQAYAYFRWVDDRIDQPVSDRAERLAFVRREQDLLDSAYRANHGQGCRDWGGLAPQERLVLDLIRSDDLCASGLHSYVSNMMAVMAFDANRRDRLVTGQELEQYSRHLSVAVTDALHYFIGHEDEPPIGEARYFPAMAAHITHMLRDTFADIRLGYFNVPLELLESGGIDPRDVESAPYRDWVSCRVHLARAYFKDGSSYLDQVKSTRCRLAGYAYMARFAGMLDAIEREGYRLRPAYAEFSHPGYALKVGSSVLRHTFLRGTR